MMFAYCYEEGIESCTAVMVVLMVVLYVPDLEEKEEGDRINAGRYTGHSVRPRRR